MSRIPGTADSVKRIDSNSLFTKSSRLYNTQKFVDDNFLLDSKNALNLIDPTALSEEKLSLFIKRLDDYEGYFSTQQLENIDYDKFENHVFFDSAVSKVSYAFDKVFNNYPYDKSEFDYIQYINSLDGYTKYILDKKFPHFLGCIKFYDDIKIVIKDKKGSHFNDYKPKKDENVFGSLNPGKNRYSFNFWLKSESNFISDTSNNQVVFKKVHDNNNVLSGFLCFLSLVNNEVFINFKIINGTNETNCKTKILTASDYSFDWTNIQININNSNSVRSISFFVNNMNVESNSQTNTLSISETFTDEFNKANFVFGHSESISDYNNLDNVYIDEFKYFNRLLSQKNIESQYQKNIFSQRGLKLYLKFNESNENYASNHYVLDHSGNKLHGVLLDNNNSAIAAANIPNYKKSVEDAVIGKPLKLENKLLSPTIFPNNPDIIAKRKNLIELAQKYDNVNPNIIFKLMPKYYFLESSDLQNLPIYSNSNEITYDTTQGLKANSPANNQLVNILTIWARFFDNLKLYIDSLVDITNLDYENFNKEINGVILPIACKKLGFEFKELLSSPNKSKLESNKLKYEDVISERSLRQIQNNLWKRILVNSKDYIMSKGTKNSIKSIFNSFGVKHDNFFTLREYSDMNLINFTKSGLRKNQHYMFLNFLDFNNLTPSYSNTNEFSSNIPYIRIHQTNNNKIFNDNWNFESFINFEKLNFLNSKQSIFRINEIDSNNNHNNLPLLNLYFKRKSNESEYYDLIVDFIIKVNNSNVLKSITLENINIFEGIKYISFDQKRLTYDRVSSDLKNASNTSDVWYEFNLHIQDAGYINIGRRSLNKTLTVKFENGDNGNNLNYFNKNSNKVEIHSGFFNYSNSNTRIDSTSIDTTFQGKINCFRLWKKSLSENEKKYHSLDLKNTGEDVYSPGENLKFNFQFKKEILGSDIANNIYSLNSFYNLESISCDVGIQNVNNLDKYNKSKHLTIFTNTMKIDEPNVENKVNILSFNDEYFKKLENNQYKYPIHDIPDDFDFQKEKRFSVELSNVKFLNDDISQLISATEHFSNSIINSTELYAYDYSSIKEFRKSYFKRLDKEIDHKILLNFFKFFDNALQDIIKNSIASNVSNLGFNFIYESHSLERHKYEYKMSDNRVSLVDNDYQNYPKENIKKYRNIFQVIE